MKITAAEYAQKINVSASLVALRLKENCQLPYTDSIEKYKNIWIIELSKDFNAEKAAKEFKIYKNK
jgi:hypothetical protein